MVKIFNILPVAPVLILVCVEVSVGAMAKKVIKNEMQMVLILVCVEVSVGVEKLTI